MLKCLILVASILINKAVSQHKVKRACALWWFKPKGFLCEGVVIRDIKPFMSVLPTNSFLESCFVKMPTISQFNPR